MAPTVSIIIPIFNAEAYLARCLDSILAQSYSDWECILVEDGSTDGSGRICDCYAAKDARFKAIHGSNKGVSTARNKGIQLSGGQWFYFCDADDEVMPNALETLIHECDSSGSDLVFGGYVECDEHGLVIAEPSNEWHRQLSVDETLCELYKATNCTYEGYLWCKLLRAELIRDHHIRFAESTSTKTDCLSSSIYAMSPQPSHIPVHLSIVTTTTTTVLISVQRASGTHATSLTCEPM